MPAIPRRPLSLALGCARISLDKEEVSVEELKPCIATHRVEVPAGQGVPPAGSESCVDGREAGCEA